MAPGKTWQEFLASIRRGECLSWGSEMGFTNVLGDVYRSIGTHYRQVTNLRNPEYSPREKAQHLFFSIASIPIFAAGLPAAVFGLNYAKQVALYCAPTADDRETWLPSMRHVALEGRCFVLTACQFIRKGAFPEGVTSPWAIRRRAARRRPG